MDGRHRTVVPGVHRLQHVQRLRAADLSDEYPVGAHSQAVAQQLADRQLALAFDVRWTMFEGDDVGVVDLQLRRVLDRDHALVVRDETRDHVQRRGLARPGAARDKDVHAAEHRRLQELRHRRAQAALVLQVLDAEHRVLELADRQRGAVDRRRSDDRVDAAAVGQTRVDHRVETVDVASGGCDHAADRLQQLVLVLEADVRFRQHASTLDEDLVRAVDHDLAHRAVVEKAVERAVADGGAKDDVGERRLLLGVEVDAVLEQEAVEVGPHRARERQRVACGEADVPDQREAVAEVIRELVQVASLACRGFEDVGAPSPRSACRRNGSGCRPHLDVLRLEQRRKRRDRGDHPLQLGQPDLDRDAVAVRLRPLGDVSRDPFAVAEAQDGFARGRAVTGVGLQRRIVDRSEYDVLDIACRDDARASRVGRRVDQKTLAFDDARFRFAFLEPTVEPVDDDLDARWRLGAVNEETGGNVGYDLAHRTRVGPGASTRLLFFRLLGDVILFLLLVPRSRKESHQL